MSKILVTGGAGFIGSHTCVELLLAGHQLVVLDNLSNSSKTALDRVEQITGHSVDFVEGDLTDPPTVDALFARTDVEAVVHFAGLKAVGESTEVPLRYYWNNVAATNILLEAMQRHDVRRLVFSSSCTVYGDVQDPPIDEDHPLGGSNPYGRTKLFIEEMMRDLADSEEGWHIALLRYFNPVGAHPSGLIGEDPRGIPNNLMPYVMQVAVGRRDRLSVFGGDYSTVDGTGVRDYIHVVDLARGHLAALSRLDEIDGCRPFNLGAGKGYSVLEVVAAASRAVGHDIAYRIVDRRPGDSARVWAEPSRAHDELQWATELDLDAMCQDAWNWQQKNPQGFDDQP